jgi:hypothetical protein
MQAAVMLAAYVYNAAMRDDMLPKPAPPKPESKPEASPAQQAKPTNEHRRSFRSNYWKN